MSRLTGRKALITGASRGIGLAITKRFVAEGATCALIGRNDSTLQEVLRNDLGGAGHTVHVGDVGHRSFWEDKVIKEVGEIDILVNAAGVTHSSFLVTTKADKIEEILQTNLYGTIWGCRSIMKGMMKRRKGSIINIASLLAVKGGHGNTAYAASKAGIVGLTRALAAEAGRSGIRVNALLPGYIETQMTDTMSSEARTNAINAIPMGRFGTVEDIADGALFLATNAYANNCILNIDGGLSAT